MTTRPDIDAIKARLAGLAEYRAIPHQHLPGGVVTTHIGTYGVTFPNQQESEFAVYAPADMRALLDYVAQLECAILLWHNTANDENAGMDEAVMACDNLAQWVVNDGKA